MFEIFKKINNRLNPANAFKTVWKVKAGGEIGFSAKGSFYIIDWGDGCVENINDKHHPRSGDYKNARDHCHVYEKKGQYTVSISSGITAFETSVRGSIGWLTQRTGWFTKRDVIPAKLAEEIDFPAKLIEIKQWGAARWETMESMFSSADSMICTATDKPNTSKVKNMRSTFSFCKKFNAPIQHWDFSSVETLDDMLIGTLAFNQDLREINTINTSNENMFGSSYKGLFGSSDNHSLAEYNERHEEKYESREQRDDFLDILAPH